MTRCGTNGGVLETEWICFRVSLSAITAGWSLRTDLLGFKFKEFDLKASGSNPASKLIGFGQFRYLLLFATSHQQS